LASTSSRSTLALYADLKEGPAREKALQAVRRAAEFGDKIGLEVHGGHGLDYRNLGPIVAIPEIAELSIGFSIVARAPSWVLNGRSGYARTPVNGDRREQVFGNDHRKYDGAARRRPSGKYFGEANEDRELCPDSGVERAVQLGITFLEDLLATQKERKGMCRRAGVHRGHHD